MKKEEIMACIDHTLLKPTATMQSIEKLCEEAVKYHTASVCIPSCYVKRVKEQYGDAITVCTVVGFPLGYSNTQAKLAETKQALLDGASEIDMVINLCDVKNGDFEKVEEEIRVLKKCCGEKILKVIVETCYLTENEKIEMCHAVTGAGADYIKTSTGFGTLGAVMEDVKLFKEHIGEQVKIKAAGGIRSVKDMEDFLKAGCARLGTSSGIDLLEGRPEVIRMIRERLDKLRLLMKQEGIDLYYIPTADFHQSEYVGEYFKCRNYMSGFTGSAGSLIVTKEEACLFTDGRYHIQAEHELEGSGIHLFKCGEANMPTEEEYAAVYMKKHNKIGFDGRVVSVSFVERFLETTGLSKNDVVYEKDLTDDIWEERPGLSEKEIYVLEDWQTGENVNSKLKRIRKAMKEADAEVHIVASLDDIAWIFNLRGNDVKNNPVFLSYGVITEDNAYLYMMESAATETVRAYLKESGVECRVYERIYEEIAELCGRKTVLLDKDSVNYALFQQIPADCSIISRPNPSAMMKAVKNKTEIENTKKAHVKDGLALTRFIHYIKERAGSGIDEAEAAEYLDGLRKNTEGCFDISFETISAYGANAAMMHYSAKKGSCAKIQKKGFLLVDSGGQYKEGTTDVTRTIAAGELSEEMKKHYTIVLCGMLRLMNARFLYGCTGRNLDILARGPVWEHGIDYRCGTGHGVGHILNVHEGPNAIRWLQRSGHQDCVLEEGMITTDEPGIYLENRYGIRIENELLCVKDMENEWGQFMKFESLTFVPIELEAVDIKYMERRDVELLNQYQEQVYRKLSPYMSEEEQEWLRKYTEKITYQNCN